MSSSVDDISSYLNTSGSTTQVSTSNSNLDYNDFLALLTAELKHQDPTDPLDNKDLILQLSQFSTLSSLSALNSNFESFISTNTISTVNGMIGKSITYTATDDEGAESSVTGTCTGIKIATDGTVTLTVGGEDVSTSDITAISNPTTTSASDDSSTSE